MTAPGGTTSSWPPPLQTLTFTLTRADALAYETLPREIGGWRLALLLVWIGLAGAGVSMLPPDWVGEDGGWRFWTFMAMGGLIQYGLATLAMSLHAHWRAARRVPHPVGVEVFDHVDHLEWRQGDGRLFVAPETIAAVVLTPGHIFVHSEGRGLILPLRAFADRGEMTAFGAELDRRSVASAAELEGQDDC